MVKYMGEDELDRQCVVRVLMHEGSKWKTLGKHSGAGCLLRGIDANACHMVKSCSMVLLLCFLCQPPREFSLHLGCLLETWNILSAFLYTMREPDHPFPPNTCACEPHDVLLCDSSPRPKKVPALSNYFSLKCLQLWVYKKQPGWTAKGNFHPSWWTSNCPDNQTFGNHFCWQRLHRATPF